MKRALLYLFTLLISISGAAAQNSKVDSVKALIKKDKQDTNKVNHLIFVSRYLRDKRKYEESLHYADTAIALGQKLKYLPGLTNAYSTIGIIYTRLSNYPKAIEYILRALALAEKLGKKSVISSITGSLGVAYWEEEDYLKALSYDLQALKLDEEMNDKSRIAISNGNIAGVYYKMGNKERALNYYTKALAADSELNDEEGIAIDLGNIGSVYKDMGKYGLALNTELRALKLDHKLNDESSAADVTCNIGEIYTMLKKYDESERYLKDALKIAEGIEYMDVEKDANTALASLYSATGRWQQAYQCQLKYEDIEDSLVSKDKIEQIGKLEAKADYDKQLTLEQAKEEQTAALANADKKRQQVVTWLVASIAIAIAVIAIIILRSLRIARKQKILIERQKTLVEEKNKEVLDSITYAKSLQDAILPPISLIKQYLPESFVLFKPKDIVAGDFYWMELQSLEDNAGTARNIILIAAADCTGHGVPGAMVSVVCSNALNRAINEFKIKDTGKVLDKVRELILETFEKSERDVKDGMDISFCALIPTDKGITLEWSGAYNPLWIIKNRSSSAPLIGGERGALIELPPDKQPVGKQEGQKPFTTHNLDLNKGDTLYLFTDGYADQFGGPKGKKYKYKQLQQLLIDTAQLTMEEQKAELEKTLKEWRGSLEQVDDILIMGIRI